MRKHARDEQEQGPAEERGAAWHHQDKTIDDSHFGAHASAFGRLGGYLLIEALRSFDSRIARLWGVLHLGQVAFVRSLTVRSSLNTFNIYEYDLY